MHTCFCGAALCYHTQTCVDTHGPSVAKLDDMLINCSLLMFQHSHTHLFLACVRVCVHVCVCVCVCVWVCVGVCTSVCLCLCMEESRYIRTCVHYVLTLQVQYVVPSLTHVLRSPQWERRTNEEARWRRRVWVAEEI